MTDATHIKCAACDVPLQGPSVEPEPDDVFACPNCGTSDTFKTVMREIEQYIASKAEDSISASFEKAARGSDFMTFKKDRRTKKVYRFVIDLDLGQG